VDLPGGSQKEMWASLRFLKTLDDDLIVHPGHEESSSIGLEKKRNYYLSKV
jgi:glyoxylase-like metal-dependent hydrolase (beta-lactamase superfamily II)